MRYTNEFDVVIVGSGAAGGMAAYDLTHAGLNVLLLEAGREYDPARETPMFNTQEHAPLRGTATKDKPGGYYDATVNGGWEVPGEPYSIADGSDDFKWWRARMLGGRTNHWGRVALRFGPYDFKPKSRDGFGFDWPISYDDIAPWYDKVEQFIGVTGLSHGIENAPDSPHGILLPPPPPRAHEIFLSRAFVSLGMKVAAIHAAILTKPHNGRSACLYATACTRGCSIRATFQSTNVLIAPSLATGRLTVRSNTVVNKVEVDKVGNVTGVSFNDRLTGEPGSIRGNVVALAAGAFSTSRILLNSKSNIFPEGIGNSNGLVGKYIMDSVEYTMSSQIPALEKIPPQNDDGIFTPHIYVPWWLYQEQIEGKLDFPRGYHIEPRGGRRMPTMGVGNFIDLKSPLYGSKLRNEIIRKYGSYVYLTGEGEMIPNDDTYCELDTNKTDIWGVPVLMFHWKWSEHEHRQVAHMHSTFNEIFRLIGGSRDQTSPMMPKGGGANHEVGGARMGNSPKNSVVDQFGQCWETRGLFVLDGATFVSSPDKNPTLTILALASRSSARIAEFVQRGV